MPSNPLTRVEVYFQGRDKYGRSTYFNYSRVGIIVSMPKSWTATRPDERYMVNLHDGVNPGDSTLRYFKTINAAKDFYIVNAAVRAAR